MHPYVELAKTAVENFVKNSNVLAVPKNLPSEIYSKKAGVFVTLHKNNELRGCVGTFLPIKTNIAEEIISNAISACAHDNRFEPVTQDELTSLTYEVSILSKPTPLENLKNHNPQTCGLIVRTSDGRSGLLLPNLSGIDNASQQFSIVCQKGGINPKEDGLSLYSFTTTKYT